MVKNKCSVHAAPGILRRFEKKIHRDWRYIFTPYKKI